MRIESIYMNCKYDLKVCEDYTNLEEDIIT